MRIIFVCIENAGRSQMAEAFAKNYGKKGFVFSSAGTNPSDEINPTVVLAMKEKGIDVSKNKPNPLTHKMIQNSDLIITMGCGAKGICVGPLSISTIDWKIEDPKNKSLEKIRSIRDGIEQRVKNLIVEQTG